jgi:hypothetical protein
METILTILPVIAVVLVVFLIREGLSYYRYVKYCKLHEAAKTGRIDTVRRLIEEGHPVNAVDPSFGLTPLHFAIRNGRVDVARLLVENGADLTQPSTQGITPLDWTSAYLGPDQRAALLRVATGNKPTGEG